MTIPPKKVINADSGDADHVGGNDWDDLADYMNNVDKTGPVKINTRTYFRNGKLELRNPADTFSYVNVPAAIAANRNINWPLLTADDEPLFKSFAATTSNKILDATCDVTLAIGAGGGLVDAKTDNKLALRNETYLIFKDGSTYYAQRGSDGDVTSNAAFSTLFQAIIDTIGTRDESTFTKIKLAPGLYSVNATITIADKYNIHIEGSGNGITVIEAGASLGAAASMFLINGSVSGTGKNLTANALIRQRDATMSTGDSANFAADDMCLLRSTKAWWSGDTSKQGEIKHIDAVNTGTGVITFVAQLFDTYNTADTANIIKLNMSKNINLSDLKITRNASATSNQARVVFDFVDGIKIQNVTIEDATGSFDNGACTLNSCINGHIQNCHLNMTEAVTPNDIYGFAIQNASQNIVINGCTSKGHWRHPFELANNQGGTNDEGPARGIIVNGCATTGSHEAGFDTHNEGEGIQILNCTVLGNGLTSGHGINVRSRRSLISNCFVRNSNVDGIVISEDAYNTIIQGCHIVDSGTYGIYFSSAVAIPGCKISNCIIDNSQSDGIKVDNSADFTTIVGNTIVNNDGDGMDIENSDGMIIANNIIKDNGAWGILFEAATCTNEVINGNYFAGNSSGQVSNGGQTGEVKTGNFGY